MPLIPGWLWAFLDRCAGQPWESKQVGKNLESDAVISGPTWHQFISNLGNAIVAAIGPDAGVLLKMDPITAVRGLSSDQAKEIFNTSCAPHCLSGPGAHLPNDANLLNRVISADTFFEYAMVRTGIDTSPARMKRSIRNFCKKGVPEQKEELDNTNFHLGAPGRNVWANFCQTREGVVDPDLVDDPRVHGDANQLREVLGLQGTTLPGTDFVRLRYPVSEPEQKKVPLSVSTGFNPYFRPSTITTAPFGWTNHIVGGTDQFGVAEIVHENLPASIISEKVRFVETT